MIIGEWHVRFGLSAMVGCVIAAVSLVPAFAQTTRIVERFADWSLYAHDGGREQICFIAAQPGASEPKGVNRAPVYFFVAGWPKDGVRTEVSLRIGYPFKKGSVASITIGTATFKLFTAADRAFIEDATEELKFLEALKKGTSMVVQGTSERGTTTKDSFSLKGAAQALQKLASTCS